MVTVAPGSVRARIRVEGIVQGVGFRPFVYALAGELGMAGFVGNDGAGVFIEAEGSAPSLAAFVAGLRDRAPALAVVDRVTSRPLPASGQPGFRIVSSERSGGRQTLVSADSATCDDCLRELFDPTDRRFRYPFINCTNCGPRFTIITGIPYDRAATTMAGFPMCPACATEYADPGDRRYHAQPVCCPACGPTLTLTDAAGDPLGGDPIRETARLLGSGRVVAVKGLGGYHLAVAAANEPAVRRLRMRKHREDKPFAVMVADLDAAAMLVELPPAAAALLTERRRPIVLCPRRPDAPLAASVAPGNRDLGVVLPYTPLHHLLVGEVGDPFVLTSGNVSDEPIAYVDADARERLAGIADAFLVGNRPIHMRTDDSVLRVFGGRPLPIRRSRGYAPEPLTVPWPCPRPVLACGAELKSTFCLAKGTHAFVSHHIGDLENYETLRSYISGIEHFQRLFDVTPEVVAHDLHPEYLSTKHARRIGEVDGVELIGIQHHHAHIASCLADNAEPGPVVGVAFDGLGFGTDGVLWGGEILRADLLGFERAMHLSAVPLPGGTAAIREPWRMAAAYLWAAYGDDLPAGLDVVRRQHKHWPSVLAMVRAGVNSPLTTSAGRLFDAVAALVGIRDVVNYEGQAAVELEQRADPAVRDGYPVCIDGMVDGTIDGLGLFRAVVDDLLAGVDVGVIAARFHRGLAGAVAAAASTVGGAAGLSTVALSGGVFQNQLLLGRVVDELSAVGCRVLVHSRVPPNDGGISLGQAVVAAARDRAAR